MVNGELYGCEAYIVNVHQVKPRVSGSNAYSVATHHNLSCMYNIMSTIKDEILYFIFKILNITT